MALRLKLICRFYYKYEKYTAYEPFFNSNCSLYVDAEVLNLLFSFFPL